MEKKLTSGLGQEYAKALDARALAEIASWCEMAANALRSGDEAGDRALYEATAANLRSLARNAFRQEAA